MLTRSMKGLLLSCLSCAGAAQGDLSRLYPPGKVECPKDHLTSYTGEVVQYRRTVKETELRIKTDWGTVEPVQVAHAGSMNPSAWFLVNGQTFAPSDWKRIETSPSHLRTGVRATAWVCDDGRNPVVDWLTPRE